MKRKSQPLPYLSPSCMSLSLTLWPGRGRAGSTERGREGGVDAVPSPWLAAWRPCPSPPLRTMLSARAALSVLMAGGVRLCALERGVGGTRQDGKKGEREWLVFFFSTQKKG